jgi:cob(I)alamin adenosyltransferase
MEKIIKQNKISGGKRLRNKMIDTIKGYDKLSEEDKHCVHIYYGYGKGKTTSAIGLIIRALGAGKRVVMIQFDKGYDGKNEHYFEKNVLRKLKEIGYSVEIIATGCERMNADGTFRFKNIKDDFSEAKKGLKLAKEYITKGKQDLLILDEVIAAVASNLLDKKDVEELIKLFKKNKRFEMVMTGHKLWSGLEDEVDLVTEMKKVKHYFDKGIPARAGIEF